MFFLWLGQHVSSFLCFVTMTSMQHLDVSVFTRWPKARSVGDFNAAQCSQIQSDGVNKKHSAVKLKSIKKSLKLNNYFYNDHNDDNFVGFFLTLFLFFNQN